jgi:hypothetical protein
MGAAPGALQQRTLQGFDYQPYSFSLRYSVVLPMPSMRAAFSLSSFVAFKAPWIACFSKTAKGTTFPAPPEAREAEPFFFVDLGIVVFRRY